MKLIKDPVHGYIKISKDYIKNVVDSCAFQRLRNIRQTSYDSLYPGSSHNRFIHSLGVFHLGIKAFEALKSNTKKQIEKREKEEKGIPWNVLQDTFELACLLHDVGHTPFSHSGENFLLIKKEVDSYNIMKTFGKKEKPEIHSLYNELLRTTENRVDEETFKTFLNDFAETIEGSMYYKSEKQTAKPHEIMSVIIALETYEKYFAEKQIDIDLFCRAILGITYQKSSTVQDGLKNALVQLLNSSIIDVDRLDYIMRDMQMSGFDSINIDIERLLESVTLIFDENVNEEYRFGYKKNALSTIEYVIVAHDAERRWIQNHPIIMYDTFLVKKSISEIERQFKEENKDCIFQKNSLKESGIKLDNGLSLRLMNDGDLLFLMKQIGEDSDGKYYINEYLARDKRRSPIWKSESEFKLLLNELSITQQKIFMNIFCDRSGKDKESSIGSTLNNKRIDELEKKIEIIQMDTALKKEDRKNQVRVVERQIFWLKKLKMYCEEILETDFEIHNERAEVFQSKITALSEKGIEIWYDSLEKSEKISDLFNIYDSTKKNEGIKLFYLYLKKTEKFFLLDFIDFLKTTLNEYIEYTKTQQ